VNLIVGANNAGKTSLLEAIYLLTSHDKQLSLTSILQERGEFLTDQELIRGRSNPAQIAPNRIDGYLVAQLFYGRKLSTDTSIKIQSLSTQNSLTISISNGNQYHRQNEGEKELSSKIGFQLSHWKSSKQESSRWILSRYYRC
jgi:AAA15 family ATPase/GTPase